MLNLIMMNKMKILWAKLSILQYSIFSMYRMLSYITEAPLKSMSLKTEQEDLNMTLGPVE